MAYETQQPVPTKGMQIGGGNRNAAGKPVDSNGKREWSHGFCGCFEECGTCCFACVCPCVVYGKNKQRLSHLQSENSPHPDGGDFCSVPCWAHFALNAVTSLGCILACMNRGDVRERYGIDGGGCGDCCASYCCHACDLTQVSREIELEEKSYSGQRY